MHRKTLKTKIIKIWVNEDKDMQTSPVLQNVLTGIF